MGKTFFSNHYGIPKTFEVGQKVKCTYYHERIQYPNRLWLFSKPFEPVKFGVIVGDAGIKPYYLAHPTKVEQFLRVKFKEYSGNKDIPISCIEDAAESAKRLRNMICQDMDKLGQPGYDIASYLELLNCAEKAEVFTGNAPTPKQS